LGHTNIQLKLVGCWGGWSIGSWRLGWL